MGQRNAAAFKRGEHTYVWFWSDGCELAATLSISEEVDRNGAPDTLILAKRDVEWFEAFYSAYQEYLSARPGRS